MGKRARSARRSPSDANPAATHRSSSTLASRQQQDASIDARIDAINRQRRYSQARLTRVQKGSRRDAGDDEEEKNETRDEIDHFLYQRDRISLNPEDDQREEEDEEDDIAHATVLELADVEEMEEDAEDEEDMDEADTDSFTPLALDGLLRESEQERHDRSVAEERRLSTAWGRNKRLYYSADTVDYALDSDQEAAQAEEEEADRMITKTLSERTEDDYTLGELLALRGEGKKGRDESAAMKRKERRGAEDVRSLFEQLEEERAGEDGGKEADVEEVERVAGLSEEEKLQLLTARSPELFGLLGDLRDCMQQVAEVKRDVKAGRRSRRGGGGVKGDWVKKMEVALLVYCSTGLMYLAMKAEGQQLRSHPINQQLLSAREQLERMLALQSHFIASTTRTTKGQQQQSATQSSQSLTAPKASTTGGLHMREAERDALGAVDSESEEEELEDAEPKLDQEEEDEGKEEEKAPPPKPKVDIFSSLSTRATQSHQSHLRTALASVPSSSAIPRFDHLEDDGDTPAPTFDHHKKPKLQHRAASVASAVHPSRDTDKFDDDEDGHTEDREQDGSHDDAALYYDQLQRSRREKKMARVSAASLSSSSVPLAVVHPDLVDGKRRINRLIEKNEGLKPSRPRDRKTPKTRNRARYEKALIKRRSQIREYAGSGGVYGGEATGIKRNVTKSTRLTG